MTKSRDVDLVIRARNEAGKAIDSATGSLKSLDKAQLTTAASATRADAELGKLGQEFETLGKKAASLAELGKAAAQIAKAESALSRMGNAAETALDDAARLTGALDNTAAATTRLKVQAETAATGFAVQKAATAASRAELTAANAAVRAAESSLARLNEKMAGAAAPSEALKQSLRSQREALSELIERQRTAISSYASQSAAQKTAGTANREATAALRSSEKAERDLSAAMLAATDKFESAVAVLSENKTLLHGISTAAAAAGESLGITATGQRELAAAAKEAAGELAHVQGLLQQQAAARADIAARTAQGNFNALAGVRPAVSSAPASAAVFEAAARQEDELTAAAARLRAEIDPAGAAQLRLNAAIAAARGLMDAGKISATEFAAAERLLATRAEAAATALRGASGARRTGGLFGLQPYELQNLSFQVNDVVTQLASGTGVLQTLGQQGGQIFQIFQARLKSVVAYLPMLAALAVPVAVFAATLARVFGLRADQREFNALLTASADGARYQADALVRSKDALDAYGVSGKDATAVIRSLVAEGLDPRRFDEVARAAKNMADVLGIDVKDAAKQIAQGFAGSYDAIKKFDDASNFLTASERERIRVLFDAGKAEAARDEALRIFAARQDDAAKKSRTEWSTAVLNLGKAWASVRDSFANSEQIKATVREIDAIARAITYVTGLLDNVRTPVAVASDIAAAAKRINEMQAELRGAYADDPNRETRLPYQQALKRIQDEKAALRALLAEQKKLAPAAASVDSPESPKSQKALKSEADLNAELAQQRTLFGDLTDIQRIRIAGEQAYRKEIEATGNAVRANAQRQFAIDSEIERQRKALDYGKLAGKIAGAESSGNPNATNPRSTATGLGQFIESTWLKLFKSNFPDAAKSRTDAEILILRKDSEVSRKLIEAYARDNAAVLQKAGVAVNEASVYLAHFLGPQGAVKVLKAAASVPVASLLRPDAIAANKSVLQGKTAGQVVQFAQRKVGQSEADRAALDNEAAVVAKLNDSAKSYNETLDARLSGWKAETEALAALGAQQSLTLEQKFAAQRADAVAKAISQAETEAAKANVAFTDERRAAIVALVGQLYDLSHAEEQHAQILAAQKKQISDLVGLEQERETLIKQLADATNRGETDLAATLAGQVADLRAQIEAALPAARELADSLSDPNAVAAVERVALGLNRVKEGAISAEQVAANFANTAVSAFSQFASAVADGQNVFKSLGSALASFAANFVQQIANMIIQLIALRFAMSVLKSVGFASFHSGGVVGNTPNRKRDAPSYVFANAFRYHSGGIAGLRPNEIPAILERGEEVLTRDNPRHVGNLGRAGNSGGASGGGGGGGVSLKIVNTIDPGEFASQGNKTAVGQKSILNVIRANRTAIRNILD